MHYSTDLGVHPLFQSIKKEKNEELIDFSPIREEHIVFHTSSSPSIQKIGCLILAGGQGTRLGKGPKGLVELPIQGKKTLFELLFNKIKEKGEHLSIAIMTSPLNHEATINYLKKENWFGVDPSYIDVFRQDMLPLCDETGHLFLEKGGKIAEAPSGNGKALFHLYERGIALKWEKRGVEYVQVIPIDNPLALPFDGEFLYIHEKKGAQLVLRSIRRKDAEEKVGLLGMQKGHLAIREYSELSEEIKGNIERFYLANTGLFSCSLDFIKKVSTSNITLPWHVAKKKGEKAVQAKDGWKTTEIWTWKFELFIFDLFPYADSFQVILTDREKCFAPLKNQTGPDSIETVTKNLLRI